MSGDYSRTSFDALRDFAGVLMQQGHPTLDADWNEYVSIVERRLRAETVDIIGRAVVPRETPTGFEIRVAAGPALTIGRGRMYVDGLLAENHGRIGAGAAPAFDRARIVDGRPAGVLDELISTEPNDFIDYTAQPYLPAAPDLPDGNGPHLAYLDVWRREVTPFKDPRLLEPALGGIDTATRWQTVWQVRLLPNIGADATCGSELEAWDALTAPSPARLTTATIEFEDPDEPCLIPPGGGYRGLENQLYRVEIHTGGPLGDARFKWSRDNASVGATIESFENGDRLQVRRIGRDSVLRFRTGDWVEITDDRREFAGLPGDMRRIEVDEDTSSLRLDSALSADLVPSGVGGDTAAARHSRVIKWDQSGQVLLADGTAWEDLDDAGSDGLIPIPDDGSPVVLEAGITVTFSSEPVAGALRSGDYWCFAARTEGAQIEILDRAPPHGIHHHYARLAVVTFPDTVSDCRIFWPPNFGEGEECGCTVCVSAEAHNSGVLTIQSAINQLPAEGGTVCLGPGGFVLGTTPIIISNRRSVRLKGHGPGSLLAYAGGGGAIRVTGSNDVRISDLGLLVVAGLQGQGRSSGVHIRNGQTVSLNRMATLVFVREAGGVDFGVSLDGFGLDVAIEDNLIIAPVAIGALAERERGDDDGPGYCALMETRIAQNLLLGQRRGVSLDGLVLHFGATDIADNLITGSNAAIVATGAGLPVGEDDGGRDERWSAAALSIVGNTISFGRLGNGIISGVPDLRILDNEIVALNGDVTRLAGGSCIRLVAGLSPLPLPDGQIVGNRMGNADGAGIAVDARQASLIIKQNVIRDCDGGGVVVAPAATIRHLALDNNVIERIGMTQVQTAVIAVQLAAVLDARIMGNSIRNVGVNAEAARGAYFAGIELRGAAMLDLSHNHITGIGPANSVSPSIGVLVDGPVLAATLADNKIMSERPANPNDPSSWAAILWDSRIERARGGTVAGAAVSTFPAFIAQGASLFALSTTGLAAFASVREAQIRLAGNTVSDAHELSLLPLMRVVTDAERTGTCIFSDNQCTLLAGGRVKFLVELEARRIIATSNAVRRIGSDGDAMNLQCAVVSERPLATVVGNISFGNIRVNGGLIPDDFAKLNILG
ncbi:hypothetical protein ACFB49_00440 [Sphingomonas sp. DBB INV C78]|uniref:DUF6519 domain-containing protein n=1 Tax=Sphingomonas sp. DBB INV C78 TaxID=3349434 RepID=UPI0036D23095